MPFDVMSNNTSNAWSNATSNRASPQRRRRDVEPTGEPTGVVGLILRGFTHLPVHARAN